LQWSLSRAWLQSHKCDANQDTSIQDQRGQQLCTYLQQKDIHSSKEGPNWETKTWHTYFLLHDFHHFLQHLSVLDVLMDIISTIPYQCFQKLHRKFR
jgi:hypothetical protein